MSDECDEPGWQAKCHALEQLVAQLLEESASLQRKWEAARRGGDGSNGGGAAAASPPAACRGVLIVRLCELEGALARDEEGALFVELHLQDGAVRSHATTPAAERCTWEQGFALPVLDVGGAARTVGSSASSPPALCATLCDADGDGGGRPIAACVAHPDVTHLPPFAAVDLSCVLSSPEGAEGAAAMPYRSAVPDASQPPPHCGLVAAPPASAAAGIDAVRASHARREHARLRLRAEWRPFDAARPPPSSRPPPSPPSPPLHALGFPNVSAAAVDPPRAKPPVDLPWSPPLSDAAGSPAASADRAWRLACVAARGAAGGWWEPDAAHLATWNATLCGCPSLAHVHPARLRRLLEPFWMAP